MLPYARARRILPAHVRSVSQESRKKSWISRQYAHPEAKRHLATPEAYRSRSALKLLDIQQNYGIGLDNNRVRTVIDLGAAPGGWSQVLAGLMQGRRAGTDTDTGGGDWGLKRASGEWSGDDASDGNIARSASSSSTQAADEDDPFILAVDIRDMKPVEGVNFLKQDFMAPGSLNIIQEMIPEGRRVDAVLSDMYVDDDQDLGADRKLAAMHHKLLAFVHHNLQQADATSKKRGILILRFKPCIAARIFQRVYLTRAFTWVYRVDNIKGQPGRYWVCWGFTPTTPPPGGSPSQDSRNVLSP